MDDQDQMYAEMLKQTTNDDAVEEAYMIVGTVEVLLNGRTFKLEVRRTVKGAKVDSYHVVTYERMTMHRKPDGSVTSEGKGNSVEFHVWVRDLNLPTWSFYRDSANGAIANAMSLLKERRNNKNTPW
jgi:hypothetical protein